ncbi:MAG: hypothetical protein K1Y36_23235 [Blastocatellia bacterium]|nr:hypothetical protein [Blastocatellia bacterium]
MTDVQSPELKPTVCPTCEKVLESPKRFCNACGALLAGSSADLEPVQTETLGSSNSGRVGVPEPVDSEDEALPQTSEVFVVPGFETSDLLSERNPAGNNRTTSPLQKPKTKKYRVSPLAAAAGMVLLISVLAVAAFWKPSGAADSSVTHSSPQFLPAMPGEESVSTPPVQVIEQKNSGTNSGSVSDNRNSTFPGPAQLPGTTANPGGGSVPGNSGSLPQSAGGPTQNPTNPTSGTAGNQGPGSPQTTRSTNSGSGSGNNGTVSSPVLTGNSQPTHRNGGANPQSGGAERIPEPSSRGENRQPADNRFPPSSQDSHSVPGPVLGRGTTRGEPDAGSRNDERETVASRGERTGPTRRDDEYRREPRTRTRDEDYLPGPQHRTPPVDPPEPGRSRSQNGSIWSGSAVWNGSAGKRERITIYGFPGIPVQVSRPFIRGGQARLVTPPSPSNGWRFAVIEFEKGTDGRGCEVSIPWQKL